MNYTNNNIIYGTSQNGSFYKSTNGGSSNTSISQPGGGAWVTPFVMDPNNPSTLYVGTGSVRKTTNGMASWSTIGTFGSGNMNALAIAKSNSNYLYASKGANLWKTTNGGGSWAPINTGLPNLHITYIAVHPSNPQVIAVSLSGNSNGQKVYISYNGGSSWTNYSSNLPNIPANCVVFYDSPENDLYVGMDVGVYYRNNTQTQWTDYTPGLPNVIVRELEIYGPTKKLRAATFGRGLWVGDLMTSGTGTPTYCASQGNNTSYEWISGVTVGSFNNTSAAAGYSDFTSQTVTLSPGTSHPVTLTPGFSGSVYNEYWTVYIDFNQDGDFTDAGEEFAIGSGTSAVTGSIAIPASASGETRMRVSMKYNATSTPCESFAYGEVEDYTVNFTSNGQAPVANFSSNTTTVNAGQNVSYSDVSTNIPTSWAWTFPGGTPSTSTLENPVITYSTAGTYSVTLTATNGSGSDTKTTTNYVTVNNVVPYCASQGNSSNYEWISGVAMGTSSYNSGASNYSDFTSSVISVNSGSNSVVLTPEFSGTAYTQYWKIWIDFNKDGDFLDVGEEFAMGSGTSPINSNITIPASASGQTRMRVSMKYNSYATSCESFSYGEVEDYTISINGAAPAPGIQSAMNYVANELVEISPNPSSGIINLVQENNVSGELSIVVYNSVGQVVYQEKIEKQENRIETM